MPSIEIANQPTDSTGLLRSWIGDRRLLVVAGLAVIGTGLALGWGWLAAVGVAPLIVSAAPCLVMCALGVCMMGGMMWGMGLLWLLLIVVLVLATAALVKYLRSDRSG